MSYDLPHIDKCIRESLARSTACPIEEDRDYWLQRVLYWQLQLESHPDVIKRDLAHKVFVRNLDNLSERMAQHLDMRYDGYSYINGVLHAEFHRESFECVVHCVDVENIMFIIKSRLSNEEKRKQIEDILNIYSVNHERAQFIIQ